MEARTRKLGEAGHDPFMEYLVPSAALALKQGFGRLIRSRQDRGVVAILDARIVTRQYGRVFIDTLPAGLPRTSTFERVRRWWGTLYKDFLDIGVGGFWNDMNEPAVFERAARSARRSIISSARAWHSSRTASSIPTSNDW